jgi:hypothetical protein
VEHKKDVYEYKTKQGLYCIDYLFNTKQGEAYESSLCVSRAMSFLLCSWGKQCNTPVLYLRSASQPVQDSLLDNASISKH